MYLFIYLPIYLFIHLSIYRSTDLSIYLCIHIVGWDTTQAASLFHFFSVSVHLCNHVLMNIVG